MVYELEKEHKKSSLMCKKKEELVKEIMRLEHNVNVMNERLNNQANAIKHYEQESRNKAIDEAIEASAKAICVGCGYLKEFKCTYKGGNCGVSKPMLESVVKTLEQLKGGAV